MTGPRRARCPSPRFPPKDEFVGVDVGHTARIGPHDGDTAVIGIDALDIGTLDIGTLDIDVLGNGPGPRPHRPSNTLVGPAGRARHGRRLTGLTDDPADILTFAADLGGPGGGLGRHPRGDLTADTQFGRRFGCAPCSGPPIITARRRSLRRPARQRCGVRSRGAATGLLGVACPPGAFRGRALVWYTGLGAYRGVGGGAGRVGHPRRRAAVRGAGGIARARSHGQL